MNYKELKNETGFHCVVTADLELALHTRLANNSEVFFRRQVYLVHLKVPVSCVHVSEYVYMDLSSFLFLVSLRILCLS